MGHFELCIPEEFFVRGSVHSLYIDEPYLFLASQLQVKVELLSLLKLYPKSGVKYD